MDLLPLFGYFCALLIGASLGLIGGGGSILTIPVLVYLFGIDPVQATAYSLFVVGVSSLVGAVSYMRKGLLSYKTAAVFAIPSFVAVYATRAWFMPRVPEVLFSLGRYDFTADIAFALTLVLGMLLAALLLLRKQARENPGVLRIVMLMVPAVVMVFLVRQFLIPALPEHLIESGGWSLSRSQAIMVLFTLVMVGASLSMIRRRKEPIDADVSHGSSYTLITLEGMVVGTVTGIVGAGGGFLIIPALVLLGKLPMRLAVGTSLLIITVKSLVGFTGDLSHRTMDWPFLLQFSFLAILGIFAGTKLSNHIPAEKLKQGFGWFVLVMAGVIVLRELMG